jgi:hypothetical protein
MNITANPRGLSRSYIEPNLYTVIDVPWHGLEGSETGPLQR